jgi:predicted nucleotidyltransferase
VTSSEITSRLRSDLEQALGEVAGVRALYLFGSALSSDTPRDIDLLLVYGPPLTPLTVRALTGPICELVERAVELQAHIVFFTKREASEPGFRDFRPQLLFAAGGA